MNTVNQVFNWGRFTSALRKEAVENNRTLMFTVLGVYALLSIFMILGNLIIGMEEDVRNMSDGSTPHYTVIGFTLMFAICVVASFSFKKLTRKTGRIDMFTSPTSTLEKFLVNTTIYVLGFFVIFFICAQLADLTRVAVLWAFRNDIIVPGPINFLPTLTHAYELTPLSNMSGISQVFAFGLLANAGLFLLGSVVWPRLSFLKTFAAMYAFEIALTILFILGTAIIGKESAFAFLRWVSDSIENGNFVYWMAGWILVQVTLYWGLAWYLFKRKDVISLKWWK